MANSILGGLRDVLLKNSELEKLRNIMPTAAGLVRTSIYFQKAPDGLDLSKGVVIYLDDVSNVIRDRTGEALIFESSVNVIFHSNDAELLAERVLPLLYDILQDEELQMDVKQHVVTNLEIMSHRLMLEDTCDMFDNDSYVLSVECRIEHNRSRKGSE